MIEEICNSVNLQLKHDKDAGRFVAAFEAAFRWEIV